MCIRDRTAIKATTGNITVSTAGIATFTLSEPGTVTAGVPFALTVSNARDAQNNLADGIIAVTFNDAGAHLAPDATAPTLTNITVTNGAGSSNQTLVLAETIALPALQGDDTVTPAVDTTNAITVNPGSLSYYTIGGEPGAATSGVAFTTPANDIVVTAYDEYDNVKTDHAGNVHFSSTDGVAAVPADAVLVAGVQTFVGSGFTLNTAGTQTVSVNHATQTAIKATTGNITVSTAGIATFTLSEPGTVTAGVPFALTVSNARDAQNNLADGVIAITFNDAGAHLAPDTTVPTLTNITVTNGSGSSNQTLVLAETIALPALRGDDTVTPAVDTTNAITVNPGSLSYYTCLLYTSPSPRDRS